MIKKNIIFMITSICQFFSVPNVPWSTAMQLQKHRSLSLLISSHWSPTVLLISRYVRTSWPLLVVLSSLLILFTLFFMSSLTYCISLSLSHLVSLNILFIGLSIQDIKYGIETILCFQQFCRVSST